MELKKMSINKIKPYKNNARKNDNAVDTVVKSIQQCGYVAPIILEENNIILAGHTRYKALKKLGYDEAECIIKQGLTEEQKKKYRLLDNKTNEIAEWDFQLLAEELEGLDLGDLDLDWGLEELGYLGEEKEIIEDDFDFEFEEKPKAKYGQIYQLGRHRLMCGDSTNEEDVQNLVQNKQMDLFITDPPYNVNYEGKTSQKLKIKNDKMEEDEFRKFLVKCFKNADCALKKGGAFYIWHADSEGYNFRRACKETSWVVRQCLIWNKNTIVLGRQDYHWKHEPCLYGWKEGASHFWNSDRKQSTVLEFNKPTQNLEHPTMKPVELFTYQIQNNTKINENVLDLFVGSGTTLIACEQLNRNCYAMELDPKYVDVIIKRWEEFTGKKAVLLEEGD